MPTPCANVGQYARQMGAIDLVATTAKDGRDVAAPRPDVRRRSRHVRCTSELAEQYRVV
jgi:hypothetical protein